MLYLGSCLDVLPSLPSNYYDSVCCDPPYNIESILKRFGKVSTNDNNKTGNRLTARKDALSRSVGGFAGQNWDTDIAFDANVWREVLRILKPGGYLIAFSGSRVFHKMVTAIDEAGFVIHPMIGWTYSSGFAKAHDAAKATDKYLKTFVPKPYDPKTIERYIGNHPMAQKWSGYKYGTQSLKPALEPICMAQKPVDRKMVENLIHWSVGAINVDACRLEQGRYPTNVIHDGQFVTLQGMHQFGQVDQFFYCAKPSRKEKLEGVRGFNDHPTVKPQALMRYLLRLITPPGGHVIDPFMGSGSTGVAAISLDLSFDGIELIPKYMTIARQRIWYQHRKQMVKYSKAA